MLVGKYSSTVPTYFTVPTLGRYVCESKRYSAERRSDMIPISSIHHTTLEVAKILIIFL